MKRKGSRLGGFDLTDQASRGGGGTRQCCGGRRGIENVAKQTESFNKQSINNIRKWGRREEIEFGVYLRCAVRLRRWRRLFERLNIAADNVSVRWKVRSGQRIHISKSLQPIIRNVSFHRFGLPLPQSSQFSEFHNDYNILVHKLFSTSERETKMLMNILCPDICVVNIITLYTVMYGLLLWLEGDIWHNMWQL